MTTKTHKEIDFGNWARKRHYETFLHHEYPFIGITSELDISEWDKKRKQANRKFFPAFMHSVSLAMNDIENFRYRIKDGKVMLYEKTDPNFVVFDDKEELFYFAGLEMIDDPVEFDQRTEKAKQFALENKVLNSKSYHEGAFFVSCTPWFSFTDVLQPMRLSESDTIPRILWGKIKHDRNKTTIPFSITAHHALVDGFHIGKLFDRIVKS